MNILGANVWRKVLLSVRGSVRREKERRKVAEETPI